MDAEIVARRRVGGILCVTLVLLPAVIDWGIGAFIASD